MFADIVLNATGIKFTPEGSKTAVLAGVDLAVERGEYVAIMGNSGAGKSTFLYCLSAMDRPTSGTVTLDGKRIDNLKEPDLTGIRLRMGFVFQQINLLPHLTLLENVVLPGLLAASPVERARAFDRAAQLLARVGVVDAARRHPAETSGGQQQRAAIARALMLAPTILFADEPTGSLNSRASAEVLDLFDEVHLTGQTIVMVTHDPKAAARADRVVYMADGAIIGEYRPERALGGSEQHLSDWLVSAGW